MNAWLISLLFLVALLLLAAYAVRRERTYKGYVQVTSGPGRPPTPASLRNREPMIKPPVDAILTLYLHCVVACPHEGEALKAVSAWLDAQPEIANIELDIAE